MGFLLQMLPSGTLTTKTLKVTNRFSSKDTSVKFHILVGSPVIHNNLMASLPTWGPSYRLSLNVYINSFHGRNLRQGKWAELLRVTRTNNNCCAIGDRIPAILINKGGFIQVATNIGNTGNKWKNVNLNEKRWYKLDIIQYQWNNKVRK